MKHIKVNLLDNKGEVQYGLKWGLRDKRDPNEAYLQLEPEIYKGTFFPKKGKFFIVKTDDNRTLILTRAQKDYGCALQTPENNSIIGSYIRERLGVPSGKEITKEDFEAYGKSDIDFYKIDDMQYLMSFSSSNVFEDYNRQNSISSDLPLQLIYYGAPGTGKSFTIDKATNENNSVRTTFHPDSDYASFVGAYKPTMAPMPVHAFVGTTVHHAKNAENEKAYEKKIVYKYVPQAFLKAYVESWKRYAASEDNPYYLVIEEINRGNCAQIFGDLFQLLDRNNMGCSSYAISADEDIAQFLREDDKGFGKLTEEQKNAISFFVLKKDSGIEELIGPEILNGSKLLLPPNLRIWATMNTSDQSLFPIDSAFKRRWNWEYMPIEYDPTDKNTGERLAWKLEVRGKMYYWGQFLDYINPRILKLTMSEDKQMGYFFAKPDKRGSDDRLDIISEKVFVNKVLFYLWTDVFKDYDLTEDPFVYESEGSKTRTAFRFTDFFSTKGDDMLAKFVEGFKLPVVGELTEEDITIDLDEMDSEDGNNNSRTLDRYTVNGNGNFLMGPAAIQAMTIFIANNPDYSATEIVSEWGGFKWPKVYTAEQYEEKKSKSTDTRIDKRYTSFDLSNGDVIYMSIGFIPETMADFIRILDTKNWGITIRKID